MFSALYKQSRNFLRKGILEVISIPAALSVTLDEKKVPLSTYPILSSYFYSFTQAKSSVPTEVFTETYENIVNHVAEFIQKSKNISDADLKQKLSELGNANDVFAEYIDIRKKSISFAASIVLKGIETLTNTWNIVLCIPVAGLLVFGLGKVAECITAYLNNNGLSTNYLGSVPYMSAFWGTIAIIGVVGVGSLIVISLKQQHIFSKVIFNVGATTLLIATFIAGNIGTAWITDAVDEATFETSYSYIIPQKQSKTLLLNTETKGMSNVKIIIVEDDYAKQLGTNIATIQFSRELFQQYRWLENGTKPRVMYSATETTFNKLPATILHSISNSDSEQTSTNERLDKTVITLFLPKDEFLVSIGSTPVAQRNPAIGSNIGQTSLSSMPFFTIEAPNFNSNHLVKDNSLLPNMECAFDIDLGHEVCTENGLTGEGQAVIKITKL